LLIAKDLLGNRIHPEKGEIAYCPFCGGQVNAVCGDINVHHWRHVYSEMCDSWHENESEWHLNWKNRFPKDWQEVILIKNGVKHIADIETSFGLVLELQNSSISSSTIRIREQFYGEMIWLINANEFKDNFDISSKVKKQLRYVDEYYKRLKNQSYDEGEELVKIRNSQSKYEQDKEYSEFQINDFTNDIENANLKLLNIEKEVKEYFESSYYSIYPLKSFKKKYKSIHDKFKSDIQNLNNSLTEKEKLIKLIDGLEFSTLDEFKNYRELNHDMVDAKSYSICIVVKKDTVNTIFPEIRKLKSEGEFNVLAKNPKYKLYINLEGKLSDLKNEIFDIKNQINVIEEQIDKNKEITRINLFSHIENNIEKIEIELLKYKEQLTSINSNILENKKEIDKLLKQEQLEIDLQEKVIEEDYKRERYEVMKTNKGLYSYRWKHRRKSWDVADRPIFFDFNNHIFKVVNEDTLKKISHNEFIEQIKTNVNK